ncbi:hypothetical protein LZG04_11475 [Saccharothrix sp. S26]|uniref:hypothetical protein n=1 Tax=Saccharothrix sp. S26 TaxID=2907215 RepID=UPI001F38DD76|nr:hypothetical protein [Saccharothrix sp. S26]MCE6995422.1 hypothetical protein [Saccharothrix sp. S26]
MVTYTGTVISGLFTGSTVVQIITGPSADVGVRVRRRVVELPISRASWLTTRTGAGRPHAAVSSAFFAGDGLLQRGAGRAQQELVAGGGAAFADAGVERTGVRA